MKKLCFINGSPKTGESFSGTFIDVIDGMLNKEKVQTEKVSAVKILKRGDLKNTFEALLAKDILVFAFPLYIDAIPSSLLEFLERFADYAQGTPLQGRRRPRVYALMNCGFIEGTHNRTALRIMEHFAHAAGLNWRFGVGVGAGEFMRETQGKIPLQSGLKKSVALALDKLKRDMEDDLMSYEKNLLVNPAMGKWLFIKVGDMNWVSMGKKNGLSKRDLYAKPCKAGN